MQFLKVHIWYSSYYAGHCRSHSEIPTALVIVLFTCENVLLCKHLSLPTIEVLWSGKRELYFTNKSLRRIVYLICVVEWVVTSSYFSRVFALQLYWHLLSSFLLLTHCLPNMQIWLSIFTNFLRICTLSFWICHHMTQNVAILHSGDLFTCGCWEPVF